MPKELRAWPKLTARLGTLAPRSLHREVCFINIAGAPECPEKRTVSWDEMNSLSLSLLQLQRIRVKHVRVFDPGFYDYFIYTCILPSLNPFLCDDIDGLMVIENSIFRRFTIEKIRTSRDTDILEKVFFL